MHTGNRLIRLFVLLLTAATLARCGAPAPTPTPTAVPLIEYKAPGSGTPATLTGQLRTSMNMSTGAMQVNAVQVELESGEIVDAYLPPGWEGLTQGMPVIVAPVDHDEYQWAVVDLKPSQTPITMRGVDGTIDVGYEITDFVVHDDWVLTTGILEDERGKTYMLSKIDAASGEIAKSVPLIEDAKNWYAEMAVGAGSVWVHLGHEETYRVDPQTMEAAVDESLPNDLNTMLITDGVAWLIRIDDDKNYVVVRHDLATGAEISTVMDGLSNHLAATKDAIWTNSQPHAIDGTGVDVLARLDPASGQVVGSTPLNPGGCGGLAAGADAVWLANNSWGAITQYDAGTGELLAEIPVVNREDGLAGDELRGIAFGEGAVWVCHEASGSLIRLDPGGRAITHVFSAGQQVRSPQVAGGRVWMIAGPSAMAWVDTAGLAAGD
jgi:hypothetical protein